MAHGVNVDINADALGAALGQALAAHGGHGGQGNKRVPLLEGTDPDEWKDWVRRFEMVATIAGWNDLRKRRELYAAMTGTAAKAVHDIPVEDPAGGPVGGAAALTYAVVKANYESRFLTAAASDQARADFQTATQLTDESLLTWHGRCRELFMRAFPTADVNAGATGQMLRDRFIGGLDQRTIKEFLWDRRPDNYADCLTSAQTKEATIRLMDEGSKKKTGLHAVGKFTEKMNFSGSTCYFCSEAGHVIKRCPLLTKAREFIGREGGGSRNGGQNHNSRPSYGGNKTSWRGRRGGGGRRGGRGGRVLAAMTAEAEDGGQASSQHTEENKGNE